MSDFQKYVLVEMLIPNSQTILLQIFSQYIFYSKVIFKNA